jgi:hypothetical protein
MRTLFLVACLALLFTMPLHGQESIAVARDLYTAANYDDALVLLSRLDSPGSNPSDRMAINQYRAFCLLALGRAVEAERAIEAVVSTDPLYHPTESDASPRLRTAFASVRQRILPVVVQQDYARAKAAFDRQEFSIAAAEFDRVLAVLGDPDLGPAALRPPLSDLRTLAVGFRDLSARAVPPPPVQPLPEPAPAAATSASASAKTAVAATKSIYNGGDLGVVAPVIIRQVLPAFQREMFPARDGVLEILISEAGVVEAAAMRMSMNPRYDSLVINAARGWKYQPATVEGVPVKFRKIINISLKGVS